MSDIKGVLSHSLVKNTRAGHYQKSRPRNYNSGFNYLTVQEEAGTCVQHHGQFPCSRHPIRLFGRKIPVLNTDPQILLIFCSFPVL